jgi:hypothetical protein
MSSTVPPGKNKTIWALALAYLSSMLLAGAQQAAEKLLKRVFLQGKFGRG